MKRKYRGKVLILADRHGQGALKCQKRILMYSEEDVKCLSLQHGEIVEFDLVENSPVNIIRPSTTGFEMAIKESWDEVRQQDES